MYKSYSEIFQEVEKANLYHQDITLETTIKPRKKQNDVFSYWGDDKVIRKDYDDE